MNARRFDALTVTMAAGNRRASRRKMVKGLAGLAAMAITPGVAQAFDGGVAPAAPAPPGAVACVSGADCRAGEICLNGACAVSTAAGGAAPPTAAPTAGAAAPSGTVTPAEAGAVPGTTPVAPPEVAPTTGVGGLIQPGAPLPARIYAGTCGSLGPDAAFQLIDVGSVEGVEEGEAPQGALTAIPAEFSTTVVNATFSELLAADFAIDIRVDDADPATSIACGDIGGPVEAGADGNELAVGLQERGQSAYAGIASLQDEGERTLVRVFLARGLEEGVTTAQQAAPAEAEAEQAAAPAEPAAVEAPQVAGTPVVGEIVPLGPGSTVVTTIDVNLRAEPSEDAAVVSILGQGVALEVTGTPANGWVPVVEPASGQRGFVSDQFVSIAT